MVHTTGKYSKLGINVTTPEDQLEACLIRAAYSPQNDSHVILLHCILVTPVLVQPVSFKTIFFRCLQREVLM